MDNNYNYYRIIAHYERCLISYGPNYKGMDWPNEKDLEKRFKIMLEINRITETRVRILDLGCGVGLLVDFLKSNNLIKFYDYIGIDISKMMIEEAKKRHPEFRFEQIDILKEGFKGSVDYTIMNGVLTEKVILTQNEMERYAQDLIKKAHEISEKGIAFNVMSPNVDWKRDDLFYWSLDDMSSFLVRECGRSFIIRHDYGLYEYTVYLYKKPI